jgi:DNA-binding beta-propeller fold protein YncE
MCSFRIRRAFCAGVLLLMAGSWAGAASFVAFESGQVRPLAMSPDGSTVYAAVFHSGNQTTTVHEGTVCDGGAAAGSCINSDSTAPGGLPAPNVDSNNKVQPETGLIVKHDGTNWKDELGRNWDSVVRFSLPDKVGIFDVTKLENDTFVPDSANHVSVSGGGPAGIVLDETRGRLYVTTRFDNGISVIDTALKLETGHLQLANPETCTRPARRMERSIYRT